ncbi:MAG: hypothetical protein HDS41_07310 [Bacteroides sp.]|nr:hypothetical protein [Bacteroides sp.]
MSDKRFKWLLAVSSLTCIIAVAIWKYPDIVKANAAKDMKLGEYAYVDPCHTVHASRKCPKLNYKGWKSERIKIDSIDFFHRHVPTYEISFCPNCVNDKDYEKFVRLLESR